MEFLEYQHFHLVGIKGVAMTALAQCLWDAGKQVTGSDVAENFVTQSILESHQVTIQLDFTDELPPETDCVIYTAAHQGKLNPQVLQAGQRNLAVFSHAAALGQFFNLKKGIAVAGVGGKSTTSAMLTWIFDRLGQQPSFAVGVGNIAGLNQTGHWQSDSDWFIAEADEYAVQPHAPGETDQDWHFIPRFHYLNPQITVCTNLEYDHPDVYPDFQATLATFKIFFTQIRAGGSLIYNSQNQADIKPILPTNIQSFSFGEDDTADLRLLSYSSHEGKTETLISFQGQTYSLTLIIPGKYNVMNALAAILAAHQAGLDINQAVAALAQFRSTTRRFEFVGEKNGVKYYDDYAHHPHEIAQAIQALNEWYPEAHKIIAFQSHTYSRTKELFNEFVDAFAAAQEVVMIDIFPSARESLDPTVTSTQLCAAISAKYPQLKAQNLATLPELATYLKQNLHSGDVCLTLGAGDIYQVHQLL